MKITVETIVHAPIEKVWKYWSEPQFIHNWNYASDDWHSPHAENDLKVGGRFKTVMAARDGSVSFDFGGVYTLVKDYNEIEYTLDDERLVSVSFQKSGEFIKIVQTFEPENENPPEMQKVGWQAILNNFKKYTEEN